MIHPTDSDDGAEHSDEDDSRALAVKDDPQFTLAVTRGRISSRSNMDPKINFFKCILVDIFIKNQNYRKWSVFVGTSDYENDINIYYLYLYCQPETILLQCF